MTQTKYSSRQRVMDTLNHREPDRIPLSLGCSLETAITKEAYQSWMSFLDLKEEPDETLYNIFYDSAGFRQIPENILKTLKIDTRGFLLQHPTQGDDPEFKMEGSMLTIVDDWGVTWGKPESSLYFDPVGHPLAGDFEDGILDRYTWPDPLDKGRFEGVAKEAQRLRKTGCAVNMSAYGIGLFDYFHLLRGMETALMDLVLKPKETQYLLEKITEIHMIYWEKALEEVGSNIDVCFMSDDLGMQNSPIMSVAMYRKYIKPAHTKIIRHIREKAKTDIKIMLHSCGSVRELIPEFIEAGVDVLNPIQVSAAGMDSKALKQDFGKDICFWGGGCDTQMVLPKGSVQDVKDEVKRRIDDLAPGGGFVFAPVHNLQADIPAENIQAMYDAFQEHCKY